MCEQAGFSCARMKIRNTLAARYFQVKVQEFTCVQKLIRHTQQFILGVKRSYTVYILYNERHSMHKIIKYLPLDSQHRFCSACEQVWKKVVKTQQGKESNIFGETDLTAKQWGQGFTTVRQKKPVIILHVFNVILCFYVI